MMMKDSNNNNKVAIQSKSKILKKAFLEELKERGYSPYTQYVLKQYGERNSDNQILEDNMCICNMVNYTATYGSGGNTEQGRVNLTLPNDWDKALDTYFPNLVVLIPIKGIQSITSINKSTERLNNSTFKVSELRYIMEILGEVPSLDRNSKCIKLDVCSLSYNEMCSILTQFDTYIGSK
jgi:hypothetical protein